jgi:hypothetical protein
MKWFVDFTMKSLPTGIKDPGATAPAARARGPRPRPAPAARAHSDSDGGLPLGQAGGLDSHVPED